MDYPIKTISQLPLILKGFRKECGLTQAVMAEKLGITQQSYAYFEANPAKATLDRLFMVLRIMGVEISLSQAIPARDKKSEPLFTYIDKANLLKKLLELLSNQSAVHPFIPLLFKLANNLQNLMQEVNIPQSHVSNTSITPPPNLGKERPKPTDSDLGDADEWKVKKVSRRLVVTFYVSPVAPLLLLFIGVNIIRDSRQANTAFKNSAAQKRDAL